MQFGGALQRLLQRLVYINPTYGPPLLAKIDLADGYYHVSLSPTAALGLAVVIPTDIPGDPPLIAIPLTLPMGWAQSPPYFCAFSETVTNLANHADLPKHTHPLLSDTQLSPAAPHTTYPQHFQPQAVTLGQLDTPRLQYTDVYIDDFIVIAQQPQHLPAMNRLMHSLTMVFHDPPHTTRRQTISTSKIAKGDAAFATQKRILGWDIDTTSMTLSLPEHRLASITTLLDTMVRQQRTSVQKWRHLLGVLRSTTPALYGAKHLFSLLQHALSTAKGTRIRLTPIIHATLTAWKMLATTATQHPVPLFTVVPRRPDTIGAVDASKTGMGGFFITQTTAAIWRAPLPTPIQTTLVSNDNPQGTITNSDLELAAAIVGGDLAATHSPQPHPSVLLASDNMAAVAWIKHGSTTTQDAPAYLLHYG
jgi:hypothetical protein